MASTTVNETSLCSEGHGTGHAVYLKKPDAFNGIAPEVVAHA
jgi:hypothetical protein